jgi:adenosylhomocysteine nucleosidase
MHEAPLAIVSAMHEELRALLPLLVQRRTLQLAGREFHQGEIHGHAVVLVLSGIGKVAAASTAVLLMQAFNVRQLIFTGVAGGLHDGVAVGDVVVARHLLQHDMDASPLFPRFEVPLTGRSRFPSDTDLADELALAAQALTGLRVHQGLIVSGDRFISSVAESRSLRALLPDALAVEMEGAAVAQVCVDFDRPFAVVRTISDRADDEAHVDFKRFIEEVASATTRKLVEAWLCGPLRHTQTHAPSSLR